MKYILRYMKPLAGRIMGGMSIKLFGTVMDLLIPYILAHIIDQVTPRHDVKLVLLWGGIMIVLLLPGVAGKRAGQPRGGGRGARLHAQRAARSV